ncbi:hypothetical protein AWB71_05249 [Caballeronia peredens]|nr:hypothetical protein AWB71_05249 [Caballeronia peredens]
MFARIVGSLLAALAFASNSHAGDLDDVRAAQSHIQRQQASKQALQDKSDALDAESQNITADIFLAFYKQAKKAGVGFAKVDVPTTVTQSNDGLMTNQTIAQYDGGLFAIVNSCVLGITCTKEPTVNIKGLGGDSLTMYFDGPNDPGHCGDGVHSLSCTCRFAAFSDFLSKPCSVVFDEKRRPALTRELITWMNHSLAQRMK